MDREAGSGSEAELCRNRETTAASEEEKTEKKTGSMDAARVAFLSELGRHFQVKIVFKAFLCGWLY